MTEGSVEAMDCVIAAMGHTELEPEMHGTKEPPASLEPASLPPLSSYLPSLLGKRRSSSTGSINARHTKTATYGKGTCPDSDEAITVHSASCSSV